MIGPADDTAQDVPWVALGDAIPRTLHQVFWSGERRDGDTARAALPPELARNVAAIRRMNPGWEHRLYDDRDIIDYVERHYGRRVLASYLSIDPAYGAARADLFRYLLMYREGGVYLDIKSMTTRPLDEVIRPTDRFLLSHWGKGRVGWGQDPLIAHVPGGEFQQWHIICAVGHPFLRAAIGHVLAQIDGYRPWRQGIQQKGVLSTTGPFAYTQAIYPILSAHPYREVFDEAEIGLTYSTIEDFAHHRFFKRHYTSVWKPIVAGKGWRRAAFAVWVMSKRLRNAAARVTFPVRNALRHGRRRGSVTDDAADQASSVAPPATTRS